MSDPFKRLSDNQLESITGDVKGPEIKMSPTQLGAYVELQKREEDRKDRARGRFQFDTVIVMGTLAVVCYVFTSSAGIYGIIGISIASFLVWLSRGFGSWN